MAISYVGGTTAVSVGNTDVSADLTALTGGSDSAPIDGDLVIFAYNIADADNVDLNPVMVTAGYTEVADLFGNGTQDANLATFYKYMGAVPDTTAVGEGSLGGTDTAIEATVMVFRGVRNAADGGPFRVASTTATGTTVGDPDPPSISGRVVGDWAVIVGACAHTANVDGTFTGPTNYTTDFLTVGNQDTTDGIIGMGYRTDPASPEDPGLITTATAATGWCAVTMLLAEAPIAAALDQAGFRGRNDDGNETTATWKVAENTDWSQVVDTNLRVRFVVDETAGGDPAGIIFQLQYNLNGAGWNDVNATSSVVRSSASPNLADSAATTRQLASGAGTFVAGGFDEGNGESGPWDIGVGGLTEVEYCVQIRSADVTNADTIDLRLWKDTGSAVLDAYSQVPTITVLDATLDQAHFRGRNDDGNQTGATWKAAEDTNWSQAVDANFRVRFTLDETAGVAVISQNYQLQYNLNGAGWNNVDAASSVVRSSASPHVADATVTTNQLTAPAGTFEGGEFDEGNGIAGTGAIGAGNFTEFEYCVQILSADVVDADTIQLRLLAATSGALDAYTQTPTVTVSEAAGPTGSAATIIPAIEQTATGAVAVAGAAASSVPITQAATGAVSVQGMAASTIAPTQAATGAVDVQGVAASQVAVVTQAATGTVVTPSSAGSAASIVPTVTQAATGAVAVRGAAASSVSIQQAATGTNAVRGAAASSVPISQAATGAVAVRGPIASVIPAVTQSATGSVVAPGGISGVGASVIPAVTQSADADVAVRGTAASTIAPTQAATGKVAARGAAASSIPAVTQNASGAVRVAGSAASVIAPVTQQATGTVPASITGTAASVVAVAQAALGSVLVRGNGTTIILMPFSIMTGKAGVPFEGPAFGRVEQDGRSASSVTPEPQPTGGKVSPVETGSVS
jgi:hypothetical protein